MSIEQGPQSEITQEVPIIKMIRSTNKSLQDATCPEDLLECVSSEWLINGVGLGEVNNKPFMLYLLKSEYAQRDKNGMLSAESSRLDTELDNFHEKVFGFTGGEDDIDQVILISEFRKLEILNSFEQDVKTITNDADNFWEGFGMIGEYWSSLPKYNYFVEFVDESK